MSMFEELTCGLDAQVDAQVRFKLIYFEKYYKYTFSFNLTQIIYKYVSIPRMTESFIWYKKSKLLKMGFSTFE